MSAINFLLRAKWVAAWDLLLPITSIGMTLSASILGISRLLKIILFIALKSTLRSRIALNFYTLMFSTTFSNITDTPLIHRNSG